MIFFSAAAVGIAYLLISEHKHKMAMSKEIIVRKQKDLDKIKPDFEGTIYIEGGTYEDPIVYERNFENAVVISKGEAFLNLSGDAQVREMRESSQVGVMRESSQVGVMRESSQVREMWESSQVGVMRESSQVGVMRESSQVRVMWESSQVGVMRESSQVRVMRESSQVREMRESSQVGVMRESSQVREMRESSQVGVMRESSQVGVMRESSQVRVMRESSQVREMRESSQVGVMRESSQVGVMRESSQVRVMWESSQVGVMRESSQVREMRESSQVGVMRESSQVREMRESSQVREMRESSQVKLYGEAMVSAYSAKSIECHGYNVVRIMNGQKEYVTVKMNKDSHLIVIPAFKPTFEDYAKRYPIVVKGKNAILYKAVHKRDVRFYSDYDRSFMYEVGKKSECEVNKDKESSCSYGLHVADKNWALAFGRGWEDMALLECEVPKRSIVVANDCDGKVRTSELKVIREVPKEEWYD